MMRIYIIIITVMWGILLQAQEVKEMDYATLFEKGFFLESVERNPEGAIKIYQAILVLKPADDHLLAKTYFRLAECYRKQGKKDQAALTYGQLRTLFPQEKELIQEADGYQTTEQNLSQAIDHILDTNKISMDFREAPMSEVLDFLMAKTKIDFVLSASVLRINPKVTLTVKALKLRSILNLLSGLYGTDFAVLYGVVVVGSKEEIKQYCLQKWPEWEELPAWAQEIEQKLKRTKCTLDFAATPLFPDLAGVVRKLGQINIIIHPQVQNQLITIRVTDACLENFLRLVCFYHGDLSYTYESQCLLILPSSLHKQTLQAKNKSQLVPVTFEIGHDVPPPAEYPAWRALFIDPQTNVHRYINSNDRRIAPGKYVLKLEQPGYYTIVRDINIKEGALDFIINDQLIAQPRQLAFNLLDEKTGALVRAHQILINGKPVSYRDVFKPGSILKVTVHFKEYSTFQSKVRIIPGKGPFVIKVSLSKQ